MNDRQDRGMAAVLSWLFNDGSSSAMGRPEPVGGTVDAMSIGSLQVRPSHGHCGAGLGSFYVDIVAASVVQV